MTSTSVALAPTTTADPSDYCTLDNPTCNLSEANFDYIPSLAGNVTYLAFFAAILLVQLVLGIRYKTWGFLVGMSGGLVLEIIGYVGRVQLHYNPYPFDPFLEYLICLTIGPAFLSAAIYLCLGRIVVIYGETISRVKPRTYTAIFVSCDFLSLVLQAAGGGITATAHESQPSLSQTGVNIMIAGLAFQVFSLFIFICMCAEYAWRVHKNPSQLNGRFTALRSTFMWKAFLAALSLATLTIFIRCCYRVAELKGGFSGSLANNQTLFLIFEGPMIIVACAALTIFHPGVCFKGYWGEGNFSFKTNKNANRRSYEPNQKWNDVELTSADEMPPKTASTINYN
ncbi:RTA1-domain-containing protein [Saccharata proteae CBS 121410]|uniref:RTA1-domain-containing protein n=1 Tax=Saccharata proteae CBS 121410 TaxID=1314787 RepID=A0A6A5YCY8_9PEZI|nr:RTA1-domain-containing protein [Saccharata proteae CBS 121410]